MLCKIFYRIAILIFGTLYPTYLSYKALKQKNDKECARMMMYWIVFSIFTFAESFLDIFVGLWLPFYYESKIIFIFWLISPYGNGAKILYENFVNKKLGENEQVIDDFISSLKQFSIEAFWKMFDKCSVYSNYLLVMGFNKAQLLFIQYMHNQNNRFNMDAMNFHSSIAFEHSNKATELTNSSLPVLDVEPVIDHMDDTESEDTFNPNISIDQDKQTIKPVKKIKRRRRVITEDISQRPVTRSSSQKIHAISDGEH